MKTLLFLFTLFLLLPSHAKEMGFDEVWKGFYESSHEMESLRQEKAATEMAKERGDLHWLPKISLMGQWQSTNDPGEVFFNHLGQQSVTQADFIPSTLNDPGHKQFVNGSLRVDFPLYEGGMKVNQVSMLGRMLQAAEMEEKAKASEQYAELARYYGQLLIHEKSTEALKSLQNALNKIISSYQVGFSSNPLGHSGLLGLKGVANRIEGLLTFFDLKTKNSKDWITTRASLPADWKTRAYTDLSTYLNETLSSTEGQSSSSLLLANELKVSSMYDGAEMEKARYLPQVGLFAQNNLYSGQRSTESSQSVGLYLQWELFNSDSWRKSSEARARAMAAEAKLRSARQEESIMQKELTDSRIALETSLGLLDDSNKLLTEQARNSMKLFRSGLMNALQLAEVINRRVDAVEQKNKTELQYLEVRSRHHQLTH